MSSQGGGFLASGNQGGSQRTNNEPKLVRAVTIRQVVRAIGDNPSDNCVIDGKPLGNVAFVGVVRSKSVQSTNISYSIEDGTGSLDFKEFQRQNPEDDVDMDNNDDDALQERGLPIGKYVRVVGRVSTFNGKTSVVADQITPVDNFNAVIFHQLDALHTHLFNSRGEPGSSTGGAAAKTDDGDSLFVGQSTEPSALQSRILQAIRNGDKETGVSVSQLSMQFSLDRMAVMKEIEEMIDVGTIFETQDEHFSITE